MLITSFIGFIKINIGDEEIFKFESKCGTYRAKLCHDKNENTNKHFVFNIDVGFIQRVNPNRIYKLSDNLKMVCIYLYIN